MSSKRQSNPPSSHNSAQKPRLVYSEFTPSDSEDLADESQPVADLPPNQQHVRIQASRKGRGGKTVTVITGFQTSPDSLSSLLKKLKAQCGSGGTLKQTDDIAELEIQGDHSQKILQILTQLGYKAKISGGKS